MHFKDRDNFDENMKSFRDILEKKGYVLELDHPYAHAMKYGEAFNDVHDWLIANGYEGKLASAGHCKGGIATYGLYDSTCISYEKMKQKLLEEIDAENMLAH